MESALEGVGRKREEDRTVLALGKALRHFGELQLEGGALCQVSCSENRHKVRDQKDGTESP
jgi:hypothetical protein